MFKILAAVIALGTVVAGVGAQAPAQDGIGERIGQGLDRLGSELREQWAQVRRSVEQMGVQGRVYSRLRWDKHVDVATMEIEVRDGDAVVLKGSVATSAAKEKAVQLAEDTVGVKEVVDELVVEAKAPAQP